MKPLAELLRMRYCSVRWDFASIHCLDRDEIWILTFASGCFGTTTSARRSTKKPTSSVRGPPRFQIRRYFGRRQQS